MPTVTEGLDRYKVSVAVGAAAYPAEAPFPPSTLHPEYPFGRDCIAGEANPAYEGVRNALRLLDLDAGRHGTAGWNPLGELISPGQTVVLKPNFVRDFRETQAGHGDCLITHGAILRAVLDYVLIATRGAGRIVVADAPQNDANFSAIREIVRLDAIQAFYRAQAGMDVEVYDLRPEQARKVDGVIVGHEPLAGDPAGYVKVDLGPESMFSEVNHLCHRLYGAEYETGELRSHHNGDRHEYLISRTVLEADCVIGIPKLKTHKKTGLTAGMKNLVGINGNKNWLPHHREGTPAEGGDQFADDRARRRIEGRVMKAFRGLFPRLGPLRSRLAGPLKAIGRRVFGDTNTDTVRSGNWHGNDTTWRMVVDLNRILTYADRDGKLQARPPRRLLTVVDGIVAGEGNGPLDASPRAAGLVIAGRNAVSVDAVCARVIGFDAARLPLIRRSFDEHSHPLADCSWSEIPCRSNHAEWTGALGELRGVALGFEPHFGWKGHVELSSPSESVTAG
jgi:uncharacterized protein (DUF362 family)